MMDFPAAERLVNFAPNLQFFKITNSKFSRIISWDIKAFHALVELDLSFNDIEELPENLFQHTPYIRQISFWRNKIKVIGEKILDPLRDLKFFDLGRNPGIDACYHSTQGGTDRYSTLANFQKAIKRCQPVQYVWNIVDEQKQEIENQKREIDGIKGQLEELKLAGAFSKFDFTIKINGKKFQVQKQLLADNSPLLAKMMDDNKDADTLKLEDISEEVFEEILKFMVTKEPPKSTSNLFQIYAASGRLQMKELNDHCAKILMDKVTPQNSLKILHVCDRFPNIELQNKALEEYGKTLNKK